jgi:TonB family protein
MVASQVEVSYLGLTVWTSLVLLWALGAAPVEAPVSPPVPLEAAPPALPEAAPPLEGPVTVLLRLTIDTAGEVSRVEVRESAGVPFDQAAMAAAVRWRFQPARKGEVPVEVQADVPVTFTPPPALQREFPAAEAAPEPPTFSTVVRGQGARPPPVAAGDFQIQVGQLADVPRGSATDLLLLAPGVMLANHGGEGHAETVFIRGFDAGQGKDVEFRLGGVPLNEVSHAHGHGHADTYFIIPELVSALRVTEGPYDPAQGDFGVAGTVEYQLALKRRGLMASASYGSFTSRRLALVWGPAEASEATFVGLLLRQGHGFGPNRAYANAGLMAQGELRLGEEVRLRLFGASYGARYSSAGVIRETDQVAGRLGCGSEEDAQFFCLYDPNQGGAGQRHLGSAELVTRLGHGGRFTQQGFVVLRQMRLRENFTGFLNDEPPVGEPQRGDNTEQLYTGSTLGLRGRYTPGLTGWGQPQPLELGYVARFDNVRTRSRRLRDRGGAPYRTLFDNQVRVTNLGAYVSGKAAPRAWLTLRGGVRVDSFLFGVEDENRPAEDRQGERLPSEAIEAYGFTVSPRLSAEVRLTPRLSWLTSAGLGARSSDAAALSDAEFAPFARVTSAETGLGYTVGGENLTVEARGAFFATRVSQDFVFDEEAGRNQPVGASQRVGAFALARVLWAERLDAQASVAWARASLPPPGTSPWRLLEGAVLPYIPQLLGRLDASLRGQATLWGEGVGWTVALGHSAIGPKPLPLDRFSQPIFLFDAALRGRWSSLELGLEVENLWDTRWRESEFNYVSNFRGPEAPASLLATRHFSAGAPRTVRGTLTVYLDFEEDQP